jgi:hypothetical protein
MKITISLLLLAIGILLGYSIVQFVKPTEPIAVVGVPEAGIPVSAPDYDVKLVESNVRRWLDADMRFFQESDRRGKWGIADNIARDLGMGMAPRGINVDAWFMSIQPQLGEFYRKDFIARLRAGEEVK